MVQVLQPRLLGAKQQGDDVDVPMGAGADVGPVRRDRRIVQEAQDGVAILDRVIEPVPRQAQVDGQGLQHPQAEVLQGAEQPGDLLPEVRDLGRPDIWRHDRGVGVVRRQVPAHMPEFLEVEVLGVPGGLHAEGGVAPLAT